ncbi:hypothetical protein H6P81_016870 [Aristolochia fimbriata]|uniref:F-box domain-containing protein n=1 Tax=Aristolochia fimbriata TaxID=158543 RepID=A0AAV7DZL6_ARIFI|nr:hypothetical protein H6P81_016870 [Aristolochia fimbriata]
MDGGQVGVNDISAPSFTDDLWLQIFSHLPVKPLFKFMCVSKTWSTLISDYCNRARVLESLTGFFYQLVEFDENDDLERIEYKYVCSSNETLSVNNKKNRSIDLSLDFLPELPHFAILHSCSGLLLCLSVESNGPVYYVCNPLLKTWVALPKPCTGDTIDDAEARLTYDPNTTHFRVILCSGDVYRDYGRTVIQIFSSDTGNWLETKVAHGPNRLIYPYSGCPVLHNEALYYLLFPSHVMRVDFLEGNYGVIELPIIQEEVPSAGMLYECEGHLYYMRGHTFYHLDPLRFQVWMLTDWNTKEWIMKHDICSETLYEKISAADSCCLRADKECFQPLGFAADLNVIFLREHCKIHYCDLVNLKAENAPVSSYSLKNESTIRNFFQITLLLILIQGEGLCSRQVDRPCLVSRKESGKD